ncbi:MAG TPA: TerB family tellurite resistance protein [Rudaea sp.]|nr:TerB family tellurite resistance protein [Rudaea sp.]
MVISGNAPPRSGGLRAVMREVRLALGDFVGGKLDPSHELMLQVLFGMLGALAQADGLVSTEEADYTNELMEELELGARARQLAAEAFQLGRRRQMDLEKEIQRFLISFPHGSVEVDRLYESLVRLAAADRRIRPGERQFLERVTLGLGFLPEVLDQRLASILK